MNLPLESNKGLLLLHMCFTKSKARHSCAEEPQEKLWQLKNVAGLGSFIKHIYCIGRYTKWGAMLYFLGL